MNNRIIKKSIFAKLTGYSLIIMAISAGFSLGFVFPKIFNERQLYIAQINIAKNEFLYKWMLIGLVVVLLLDILVSYSLYKYFKSDNKKLALLSGILRMLYSLLFGIAILYLSKNITQYNNTIVIENYYLFQKIWSIGLIVFGIHLLLISVLMKLHKVIPRILWYLMIIAGMSYILIHLLKTVFPHLPELGNLLNLILGLPMALAELCLAIWLIVKGGKGDRKI
ncbi:DUF4386 domain-containing protein [Flavobacterium luteum]|uniref:DUF4386 domain-containing protein n=1 Tax=Flavobacterium luteum TaxID=2026654 RepID=A0A7J5AJM2_9FLAO|nr:DUF4386 domain-containing protein [Flavobacterium luteum]KAB1157794.1 DUF4386 domain-containing protein [Flavobacterium luteum]